MTSPNTLAQPALVEPPQTGAEYLDLHELQTSPSLPSAVNCVRKNGCPSPKYCVTACAGDFRPETDQPEGLSEEEVVSNVGSLCCANC